MDFILPWNKIPLPRDTSQCESEPIMPMMPLSPRFPVPTMRLMRRAGIVLTAAVVAGAGCSGAVDVFVANPCEVALEVHVVNGVVNSLDDTPDRLEQGVAIVDPGGVKMIGSLIDSPEERTLFVEEVDLRLTFDNDELAENESTVVLPADACPGT